jgi:hypothetical protein
MPPRSTIVMDGWESFKAAVMPPDAPPVQIQEMRRAFFAGAWLLLTEMRAYMTDDVSEEQGVAFLEGLKSEMERFQHQVGKRY